MDGRTDGRPGQAGGRTDGRTDRLTIRYKQESILNTIKCHQRRQVGVTMLISATVGSNLLRREREREREREGEREQNHFIRIISV